MGNLSECRCGQCLGQGLNLRLSYAKFPIYISSTTDEDTGKTEMLGVIPQHIIPFVLGSLNISYEFVVSEEFSYGHATLNGTWPGYMGLLQKKVADMSVGAQYVGLHQFLDFCPLEWYQRFPVVYLASYGKQEMFDFFTFLYLIDQLVWYFFMVGFCLIVIITAFSESTKNGECEKRDLLKNLLNSFWIFLASVFSEGSPRTMSSGLGQLLQFLWLFTVLILVNVLYSQFKGILMVKDDDGRFRTIEDLADSPNILPLIIPNSIHENVLRDSTLESYHRLHARALTNQGCFIELAKLMETETYQLVKYGTHVLSTTPLFCKHVLRNICGMLTGKRKLYFIDEELTYIDATFYTNWDFPKHLRDLINKRLLRMREGGFVEQWFAYYYRNYERCEEAEKDEDSVLLKLKHMRTAFYLYLYLLVCSCIIFIWEHKYILFQQCSFCSTKKRNHRRHDFEFESY